LQTKTFAIGRTQGKDEWSKIRLKATLVLKSDDVVKLVKRLTLDSGVFKFPPPARVTNYFKDLKEHADDDSDD
jgi:hypothetical protein